MLTRLGLRGEILLAKTFAQGLFSKNLEFFLRQPAGELFSRFNDITTVQAAITSVVLSLAFDAAILLGCSAGLAIYNWPLAATALPFFAISFAFAGASLRSLMAAERETRILASDFASKFIERVANVRAVKAFSAEASTLELLGQRYLRWRSCAARRGLDYQLVAAGISFASALGVGSVLLLGAYLARLGKISPGDLVLFFTSLGVAFGPLQRLAPSFAALQAGIVGVERLSLGDRDQGDCDLPDLPRTSKGCERIRAVGVGHWYRPGFPVLRQIDMEIRGGEVVAIVGRTGSGKTTMAHIISGIVRPCAGEIYINDLPLSAYSLPSVRSYFGMASQDAHLFAGTVRENIAFGNPEASLESIVDAARRADAHDFITALARGYGHEIGAMGLALSTGQRQRLSLARVLLRDPAVLVLDEATNALDPDAETRVLTRTLESRHGRPTIMVTHRSAVAEMTDRVLFIDRGCLVATGTHAHLTRRSASYRRLWGAPAFASRGEQI